MIPVFLPPASIVTKVPRGKSYTVESLCHLAGIECRVTGPSARRRVVLRKSKKFEVSREPGNLGAVSVGHPRAHTRRHVVLALGVLAYSVFDYSTRESVRGWSEMRPPVPHARTKPYRLMTRARHQREWRARKKICEDASRQH